MAVVSVNLDSARAPDVLAILKSIDLRDLAQLPHFAKFWKFSSMKGDCLLVNCLYHKDNNPSMAIYSDHTYCFACKHRGDAVDMVRRVLDCSFPAALELITAFKHTYNLNEGKWESLLPSQANTLITQLEEEGPLDTRYVFWTKQLLDKPWGRWHLIPDEPALRAKVKSYGAAFFSVLSVDRPNPPCWYFGDWYLDLDGESARDDIECLKSQFKNDGIKIWDSGKKGYHVIIPTRGCGPRLPLVYGEMSAQLKLASVDMKVYSLGRGRMWREEGVRRENGRCKTRIF